MSTLFSDKIGDASERTFHITQDRKYKIGVNYIEHANGAKAQLYIDGEKVGDAVDTYARQKRDDYLLNANHPKGHIELGVIELAAGEHSARIEIVGKNDRVKNTELMIDCITVEPAKP